MECQTKLLPNNLYAFTEHLSHCLVLIVSADPKEEEEMAMVGEALLSASVQTLLDKITSSEFKDFLKSRKLNVSLLDELSTTLWALRAVLNDAEEKQISNRDVGKWLALLEDAIMDAEDLLDELNYDSLRCKVEGESQTTTNQVWKFLSSRFNQFYREMNSKMEEMCRRLKMFAEQKDILGLQSVSGRVSKRMPTSSLIIESDMVGRVRDKEKLKTMLLSDDHANSNNIGVIAILGMGGVGKTSLAQLLYNDKEVQEYFDLKAWACVSEDFDVIKVTKTILESITSRVDDNNLDFLRVKLRQCLRDKKFLFVLDDLWNEKYGDWDYLRIPFSSGKEGSKIIITTRLQRVAELSHTFPIYSLQPLSNDECWSLLAKHAFGSEDSSRNPHLEKIGRNIAKKCDGLPIAAKMLGGLLRSKLDINDWNEVLNSNLWNLPSDDILPALHLSYLYLPAHLKRCFAYCSIFPKDHQLDRKQLVLLWMAQGLVQGSHEEEVMEEIGDGYFYELLSRSLIQPIKDAGGDKFVMHDLINDLAITVSKKSYFVCGGIKIPENIQHLSFKQEMYDDRRKFENFDSLKCLRSFLPLGSDWRLNYLSKNVLNALFPTHKLLRMLTLSNYENITELPNSIKNLVHLRYLDLSGTRIKRLPKKLCTLYNLQTLILSECILLEELPAHIGKLVSLRHLDISGCKLKVMPVQIGRLENLQTLTTFVVGNGQDGPSVRELSKFPHLQGTLSILKLHNVNDAREAFDANLKGKEKIEELMLEWDENTKDSKIVEEVLYRLQPSTNLRILTINWYGGASFATWLGDSSFCNMVSLCISNCCHCITLPPLGQLPSLKELFVGGMKLLKSVGPELYGQSGVSSPSFVPFPTLEHLRFWDMENWEEWLPLATEGSQVPFPHLKHLRISNCPKLRQHLPRHLPSLSTVEIYRCYELKTTASALRWLTSIQRLNINGGEQWSLLGDEHDSPCSLQYLSIENCDSLPSLPRMIVGSNCLGSLTLFGIPSLTCFPNGGLPTSLRFLHISGCPNLEFLAPETWCNYTSLKVLYIQHSCDSLTSFPLDSFPALEDLFLWRVRNLESFSISESSVHHPSRLLHLNISNCEKLRSLSERIHTLTKLQKLYIFGLPELASLAQAGLPLNLQRFAVTGCGRQSPAGIADWGLQHLTSLSELEIGGDDIVNTLLEEPLLLPNSLVYLDISNISNMKSLKGNEFQHFTSLQRLCFHNCERLEFIPEDGLERFTNLEHLSISSCPRIESLPENGVRHLTNLKELCISDCPRLESFPEQGLPSSLSKLIIQRCPLLEARYQSQKGKHWSKIAHIPVIRINEEVII